MGISDLLDPTDETPVGTAIVEATIVRSHGGGHDVTFVLDVTAQLADGDLLFHGGLRGSELETQTGAVLPVIGGTGAFVGANGTVTIQAEEVGGEQGFRWTFVLITP